MEKHTIYSYWLAFLVAILTAVGLFQINSKLRHSNEMLYNVRDSLKVVTLENGNLLYERKLLVADNDQLNSLLKDKDGEIKKLKDKLVLYSNVEAEVKIDSIFIKDTVFVDSCMHIRTQYNQDPYLTFNLSADICDYTADILVSDISIPITIDAFISKENSVYVEVDNPYCIIKDLNTIKQSEKKVEFTHGPTIGVGVVYGIKNGLDLGAYVGYGFGLKF